MIRKLYFSILSNGIMISGFFPLGSMVSTQWGMRQVTGHKTETVSAPDMPHGC